MAEEFDGREFQGKLQRLDRLLQEAEKQADPAARGRLQEIVQAILELHGAGIERILDHVADSGEAAEPIFEALGRDDVVSGLLLLHGLHPLDLEARVEQALESVRPYLRSHGGNVELIEVSDAVVRLRLHGSCKSCSSSALTMQQTVEEAIRGKAPEVMAIEVETASGEPASLEQDGPRLALPLL